MLEEILTWYFIFGCVVGILAVSETAARPSCVLMVTFVSVVFWPVVVVMAILNVGKAKR